MAVWSHSAPAEPLTPASRLQESPPGVLSVRCAVNSLGCSPLFWDQGLGCPLKRLGMSDWNGACDCFQPFSFQSFPSGGDT